VSKLFVNANENKFFSRNSNSRRMEHRESAEYSLGNSHCMSTVIRYGVCFTSQTTCNVTDILVRNGCGVTVWMFWPCHDSGCQLHSRSPDSIPGQSVWYLSRKKRHCDRFSAEYFGFPCSIIQPVSPTH
jgi:hypothetical protein